MVCINQALEETQSLLLEMRAKIQVLEKCNALLEAQKGKGKGRKAKVGNLSNKELSVALKEETIRTYGRKYSATYCLWIPSGIFPLRKNPEIDLHSAERWLSPLSIEDGVKTELFEFLQKQDHSLMTHEGFGDAVSLLKPVFIYYQPECLHSLGLVFKAFAQKWPLISNLWVVLFSGFPRKSFCARTIVLTTHAAGIYCSALRESIQNLPPVFFPAQAAWLIVTS